MSNHGHGVSITYKFSITDSVTIIELKQKGVITALYTSESGNQYRVRYFYNGDPKDTYFYDWELKGTKTEDSN